MILTTVVHHLWKMLDQPSSCMIYPRVFSRCSDFEFNLIKYLHRTKSDVDVVLVIGPIVHQKGRRSNLRVKYNTQDW